MNKTVGHLIRILGLVIEMFGLWGVFQSNNPQDLPQLTLPGGQQIPVAWLAIGVGFVLWLTGTSIVYLARPDSKGRGNPPREPTAESSLDHG